MDSELGRPLAILVSGAPASGKTTLAKVLADRLDIFHLNRDSIWSGLRFSVQRGAEASIANRGVLAEYGTMEHLLAVGVSLVADGTMYAGQFEGHVQRLLDLVEVVNVHCRATGTIERDRAREIALDRSTDQLAARQKRLESIHHLVADPLDLGCRLIEVNTDAGYAPSVEQLVRSITGPTTTAE